MTAPKLIVFDVDGTLIDSKTSIISAMQAAFETVGLPVPSPERVLSIVGLSLPEAMRGIEPALSDAEVSRLTDAYRSGFVKQRERGAGEATAPLYDGAHDCLIRLSRIPHFVLGTATGKARRGLDVVIDTHDLHGLFTTLQTSDLHPSKPHPSMLLSASAETGIAPGQAVMVGDTSFDMEMGKAAGFATLGVAWGYHPVDELSVHADAVVSHFDEVDAAITSLLGA